MATRHLTGIWVEVRSGTMTLCGDLAALDHYVGAWVAGYGLEGQLVASSASARIGADGAFIRRLAKSHGTGGRYDGALPQTVVEQVLCSQEDELACTDALIELGIPHAQVVTFEVRRSNARFAGLAGTASIPGADPLALADAVVLLHGQFTLSSGARAGAYWETLPAANRFRVARNLDVSDGEPSDIIGVGHGGAYLATVVALAAGRRPFVVDPAISGDETLDDPAILLDDFVTTGASLSRTLAVVRPSARPSSRCVSLYGSADAIAPLGWVRVLHTLP